MKFAKENSKAPTKHEVKTPRKKHLYPGIQEAENERIRAGRKSSRYASCTSDEPENMSYDEYQRWLILMNID